MAKLSWAQFWFIAQLSPIKFVGLDQVYVDTIPIQVKIMLSWGNKFIPYRTLPHQELFDVFKADLAEAIRKVKVMHAVSGFNDRVAKEFPIPVKSLKNHGVVPDDPVPMLRALDKWS